MSSELDRWLEGRTPPAVVPLGAWLAAPTATDAPGRAGSPEQPSGLQREPLAELMGAAIRALGRARVRPGRVRDSAFDLLAADALLTYACEAALESDDAEGALEELVRRVSER